MEIKTHIDKSGRIVIPNKLREALEIQTGDEIILRLEDGTIRLIPVCQAVALAQNIVRQYIPPGTSLVEGLIADRHLDST